MFFQNAYSIIVVACGLYPVRDSDPANLAPLGDGDLNCIAQAVADHFTGALRGQRLTPSRRRKIQEWEERVHENGASVEDVTDLEKILKRAIDLWETAGEVIYDSGKYRFGGNGVGGKVDLTVHNGHACPTIFTFPNPGKSTSTTATSGMPSVKLPTANR